MNRFTNIENTRFTNIKNSIDNKILNLKLKNEINYLLKNWFLSLNIKDIDVLTTFATYLAIRINKLFIEKELNDNLYEKQYSHNSNQDLKAIILLLLPYINDEKINVHAKLKDLNELILFDELPSNVKDIDRIELLKTHFKYTNMGIGLFDINNELNIKDEEFGKLIYKIIYHNFISLNETLSMINGKLYVNWINVVPLNFNNYKESQIYKNTKNLDKYIIKFLNNEELNLLEYNGLYIGEFYNVFRNVYYENIKKVKWFIFISGPNEYIIQYLNNKFDFSKFFEFNSFEDLDIIDQDAFTKKLIDIDNFEIWKNILLFFVNNYTYKNLIFENEDKELLKPFQINNENEGKDNDLTRKELNKFNNISIDDIKKFIIKVDPMDIWNFIKESLNIFQTTIYGNYLIKDNKITDYYDIKGLNLKNIYNICKSLSHMSREWILLPTKYSSLNLPSQQNFWEKLRDRSKINDWLRLRSNIALEYQNQIYDYNTVLIDKFNIFLEIKNDLVWKYLLYNGLVSDFKVNLINSRSELTDYMKKELDKDEYKESYYYLTNKKYKDHKFNISNEEITYLKNIKKQYWYSFYAMNWITQINFYHHYLNHRVLYVTGATGQGKSTQVPKLFMYALKMLDYKSNGKVICTQPRIGPTNGNANRISDELGVPIHQYSNSFKEKIKSDNYYVQLTHSNDKHVINNPKHLTLKLLTDGTLLTEIIKNPILKQETKKKVKNKYETIYTYDNKYDILIIDEAHEHNTNMDLILTLAKQSCYLNNDIKLVIMSATMDDDEPNFRTYYKLINDNLVYPLRSRITNFENERELYDSIYLDRRFHIAPPGQLTQYDVKEIYEPNGETNDIVKKILLTSKEGHILVFENGTSDIMKRVKSLNEIIPSNIIAIPYLSSLASEYKYIIEELETMLPKIRIAKEKVYDTWSEIYTESKDVQEGTYKRCIIVATNVAEASLTIEKLKFVIDNGYSKVNKYNSILDETELVVEMISEASRKQRKGRVGRVSSGTVYYLYEKGSREHIRSKYKINQENFGESLLSLLETKELENINDNNILLANFDPNNPLSFMSNSNISVEVENTIKNSVFYRTEIYHILDNQYYHEDYLDYWDEKYYNLEYNEIKQSMYRTQSGYNITILFDQKGLFYIIHPFEDKLKRNIYGNIIEYKDCDGKWVKIKNILPEYYFKNLLLNETNKNFLVNITADSYNQITDYRVHPEYIFKTEIFKYVSDLKQKIDLFELSNNDLLTVLTSKAYGSFNEVLKVLTMIKTIKGSIKNLVNNIKIYNNQDNEIEFIYNLIVGLEKRFTFFKIFNIKTNEDLRTEYSNNVDLLIEKYLVDRKTNKSKGYTKKLWEQLNQLYINGTLRKGFDKLISNILKSNKTFYDFNNYKKDINQWSSTNNIKDDIILDYLNNYASLLLNFLSLKREDDIRIKEKDPLELMEYEVPSFRKSLTCKNKLEHIIRPFLHGNPLFIGIKMNSYEEYHYTIGNLAVINQDSKVNSCNLLFYYQRKFNEIITISITNKIEIEWLFNILPIYYIPSNFKNIILKREGNKIEKKVLQGDLYNDFCVLFKNKWSLNNIPYDAVIRINDEALMPIMNEFTKNIKKNRIISI
jgi:hypothetical protein